MFEHKLEAIVNFQSLLKYFLVPTRKEFLYDLLPPPGTWTHEPSGIDASSRVEMKKFF